jgi:3-oxoacyl-[acyl-carrier-protein] synthase III
MSPYAHITGWGKAIPDRIMTNHDLSLLVETSDEWIMDRTGIKERRIAAQDQTTASLAIEASLKALEVANLHASDLDLIIVSTSSPEHIFPATACIVQDRIGANKAGAFDILAACTGFIYAVQLASQAIRSSSAQNVLVIGSETLSRITNWKDRGTCILFGDGAGAFVLQASEEPGGVLSGVLRSDGSGGELLSLPAGGSKLPTTAETVSRGLHYIQMNGREVYRFATRVMAQATREAVERANLTVEDIDLIIPHQANRRIIEAAARGLNFPLERCIINVDRFGNTSTASIPIATIEAIESGQLKAGHKIVFVGFGAGLTWGATAVQWSGPILPKRRLYPRSYLAWVKVRSKLRQLLRFFEGIIWGRRFPED